MISRLSSISIVTSMGLHVLLVVLVVSGMLEHTHKNTETPPIKIELIQPKKLEPPPPPPKPEPKKPEPKQPEPKKPEPKQPEAKQLEPKQPEPPKQPKVEPVKPEPPTAVEPRPEPPKPEPAKPEPARPAPPSPAPQAAPAPTATEAPPKPAPPPEAVAKPAPAAPAPPTKSGVDMSASYRGSNVAPVYPSLSLKNREQGTVVLRVLVKSDGTAGNVEIKSSSDYPRLDQSAIQAVKAWRFNPATVDGKSIDEWYEVPIIFKSPKGEKSIPPLAYDIECSSDVTSWGKVFSNEELFIKDVEKIKVEPKGLLDRAKRILSLDTGRVFRLVENNVKLSDGKIGSRSSIRIADCSNNEILIQTESTFACSYGRGLASPSADKDPIHLQNWIRVSPESRDNRLIEMVCGK